MALLFATGPSLNVLTRVSTGNITASPAFDTNFPPSALCDQDPGTVGKFGSATSNSMLTVDCNVLLGGDFDTAFVGGAPVSWTNVSVGGGTIARTTAAGEFVTGAAVKCTSTSTGGGNYGAVRGTIIARPDGSLRLIGRVRGSGGGGGAAVYLYNPITGKWWDSGAWADTATALFAANSSAYSGSNEVSQTVAMESYQACGGNDTVSLQLTLQSTAATSGSAYFDEFYAWPVINAAALLGIQNIGPRAATPSRTWEWYADDQSSFATQVSVVLDIEATGPGKGLPNSYAVAAASSNGAHRYNRLNFPGLPTTAPSFGEAIFTSLSTALKNQAYGYSIKPYKRQIRNVSRGGVVRVYPYATYPETTLTLVFRHETRAQVEELFHQWYLRSGFGQWPIIVIPDSTGTGFDQTILYGRLPETLEVNRPLTTLWDWSAVVLVGLPLP